MQNLARAVLVLFGLLVLVTVKVALSVEGGEPSVPLTAQDVTGTWQGDHGARLEVTADGRARLTDSSGWTCTPSRAPAALTAEGGWTIDWMDDERPGILIKFTLDGPSAVPYCGDYFTLVGTGKSGASGDGSDVWAYFHGQGGAGRETYRRTATP
ncbi:hypothetical protein [Streptomyces virginiae]|uniref:hypothetical protein n=1 Tax=Streptomyces virginiae TaxID=1961 RepID=UPI0022571CDD|nr:hypothetical protein [Streptomyces virginiae]MCX4957020.1 hypothetical protein [Streptomyces virginiae]